MKKSIRTKISWFKHNKNNIIYKICVVLGLAKSPSYEMFFWEEKGDSNEQ